MMRFLMVHRIDERKPDAYSPGPEVIAGVGKLMEEAARTGMLLGGEGVLHSSKGARVRVSGGKRTVTDGPFTEAKEVIGGFALIQAASLDEAVALAARFAEVTGAVELEIRQVAEMSDLAPDGPPA